MAGRLDHDRALLDPGISAATEDGFVALSRSQTLEGFWGRVCPNFGSRGFVAFSKMPSLRRLGVGCKNVDDAALSTLPNALMTVL